MTVVGLGSVKAYRPLDASPRASPTTALGGAPRLWRCALEPRRSEFVAPIEWLRAGPEWWQSTPARASPPPREVPHVRGHATPSPALASVARSALAHRLVPCGRGSPALRSWAPRA